MTDHENGNGSLTRQVLRAEIAAGLATQEVTYRKLLDERFEPVNQHIQRIERGEFTEAQAAAIVKVVQTHDDDTVKRKQLKLPIVMVGVSLAMLVCSSVLVLSTLGVFGT